MKDAYIQTYTAKMNTENMDKSLNNVKLDTPSDNILNNIESIEYNIRANKKMNEIVNRFIWYKTKELELEGYDATEIENIIDEIVQGDCTYEDDASSDEEDQESYSDEEYY